MRERRLNLGDKCSKRPFKQMQEYGSKDKSNDLFIQRRMSGCKNKKKTLSHTHTHTQALVKGKKAAEYNEFLQVEAKRCSSTEG